MAQTINVDSKPALFMPTLYYSQGDVGRTFEIVVSSSDWFTIPSGATCQMVATKPSGLGFTVAGTVSGNKVTFTTTAVMTDEWGRFPAELRITSGNTVIGTANFYMEGERNPHPDGTTDGSQETLIPELTLLVERAENAAQTATDDAIEAASATIDEVLNYLPTEVTNLKSDLETYISTGVYQLSSNDFEDGGWDFETGEKIDQWRAIRTKKAYTLKDGDRFIFNTDPLYIAYSVIDANGDVLYTNFGDSLWKKSRGVYDATELCYLYISMRNSWNPGNSNPISPSDMTSELIIDDSWWTHEINDFDNAIDKLSLNVDGKDVFDSSKFAVGSLSGGQFVTTGYYAYTRRIATPNALNYPYDIALIAETGYRFGINYFDDNDTFIFDSGWQTAYTIPANQNFRITIAKQSESSSDPELINTDIPIYVKKVEFNTKLAGEIKPSYTYNANGTYINLNKQKFNIGATGIIPRAWSDIQIANVASTQGFAISNGVIFQLYSDDVVVLIDKDSGTIIAELSITSGHGNTISFSNEYYADGDEFPLAYITAESNPPKVYVNRITRSGATLIKTYKFSYETVGYYANHCLDALNQRLYMCGYTMDSYTSDENGQNKMLFTEWDVSNAILNGDGTYTPTLVKQFYLPFINTHQGNEVHDGYIWMMSSSGSGQAGKTTRIYVINPFSERIEKIISDFPTNISTEECEGLMFVEGTDKYDVWILRRVENENYISLNFS